MINIHIQNTETFPVTVTILDRYGDPTNPLRPVDVAGAATSSAIHVGNDDSGNGSIRWTAQADGHEDYSSPSPIVVKNNDTVPVKAGPPE